MNKPIFVLIVFLMLLGSLTVFVYAEMFTVPPLGEQTVTVNLNQGDSVKGTVSVTGGTGTGVDFMVSDPNGNELLSYNYTSYTAFSFSASTTGVYTLSFDNSFCSCVGGKNVTLTYSINDKTAPGDLTAKSTAAFPDSTLTILVVVMVGVAVAVVVILMRRPETNPDAQRSASELPALHDAYPFMCISLNRKLRLDSE